MTEDEAEDVVDKWFFNTVMGMDNLHDYQKEILKKHIDPVPLAKLQAQRTVDELKDI